MNMIFKLFEGELQMYSKVLRRSRKSQSVPWVNSGPVKIAVGKNFDSVVTNSGRDAFIEFYKPSCRYCKELEPVWEELGQAMRNETVDIVKIDAVNNDWSGPYVVDEYPTIYMKFADSGRRPAHFTDDYDLQHFISYIAKHATKELRGWDRNGKPKG